MALLDMIKFGGQGNPMQQQQMMGLLGMQNGVPNAGGAETGTGMAPPPPAAPPTAAPSGGAVPPPAEPTWMDKVKGLKDNPMFWLSLSNGLAGMGGGSPNTGMQQMSQMGMQHILKQRAQKQEQEQVVGRANQTADAIEKMGGPNSAETAAMIRKDPTNALRYASAFQTARLKPAPDQYKVATGAQLGMTGPDAQRQFKVNQTTQEPTNLSGSGVTVNNKLPSNLPPPKAGWQYNMSPDGTQVVSMTPIAGGPADAEQKAEAERALGRKSQKGAAAYTVIQDAQRAYDAIDDLPTTISSEQGLVENLFNEGVRAVLEETQSAPEGVFTGFIDSVKSNIGIDQLQKMRETSPTGGALGQVPFQQQKRLEALLGNLDTRAPKEIQKNNIARIQNLYLDEIHGTLAQRRQWLAEEKITPEQFKAAEADYKTLDFDRLGKPWDTSKKPMEVPTDLWERATEAQKKKMMARIERNNLGHF